MKAVLVAVNDMKAVLVAVNYINQSLYCKQTHLLTLRYEHCQHCIHEQLGYIYLSSWHDCHAMLPDICNFSTLPTLHT